MNAKAKRRLAVVTGVIVIVIIIVLAVVGGNSAARTVSVAEALEVQDDAKIQVTGNVVENSFAIEDNVLTFKIYDPEADPAGANALDVRYDGGVSATFGNDVTAICTGKKGSDGVLNCSELVTKCPSKYENAEGSLTIEDMFGYGSTVYEKPVKVSGIIAPNTLGGVDARLRRLLHCHRRRAGRLNPWPRQAAQSSQLQALPPLQHAPCCSQVISHTSRNFPKSAA